MSQALLQRILDYEDRPTKQRLDSFFQSEPRELGTRSNKAARMLGDARHLRRETRPQCWLDNASAF